MAGDLMNQDPGEIAKHAGPICEENVYADVYKVLIAGMYISTLLFIAGVLKALIHPTYIPLTSAWVREHSHWGVVWQGLPHADPTALMMLGTLLLILTPVARVLVSIYAFFVDRDYKFVVVTSIVFLVMLLTFILSQLGLR
jgi:uncharacterized membrane protein